jgi:hypothetical protein
VSRVGSSRRRTALPRIEPDAGMKTSRTSTGAR